MLQRFVEVSASFGFEHRYVKKMLAVLFSKNHVLENQDLFAVQLLRSSPLNGTSFGSISVS